mmetsp:Transcript_2868/g.8717  ORF Transcript_2868/g.8717 Transcript_2868/m.8717 type:complete len:233 (-) Transcript_2868:270-968(-)
MECSRLAQRVTVRSPEAVRTRPRRSRADVTQSRWPSSTPSSPASHAIPPPQMLNAADIAKSREERPNDAPSETAALASLASLPPSCACGCVSCGAARRRHTRAVLSCDADTRSAPPLSPVEASKSSAVTHPEWPPRVDNGIRRTVGGASKSCAPSFDTSSYNRTVPSVQPAATTHPPSAPPMRPTATLSGNALTLGVATAHAAFTPSPAEGGNSPSAHTRSVPSPHAAATTR